MWAWVTFGGTLGLLFWFCAQAHSWKSSGNHMRFRELNIGQLHIWHSPCLLCYLPSPQVQPFLAYLVKDFSDIGLRLPKPHGEQFRTLDGDEVGLALISNCFSQQSFPTARRSIEKNSLGGCHAKLKEFVWVLHRILGKKQRFQRYSNRLKNT